ncbi:hypothetical protein CF319_g8020 [Tilletia indica]|nr:hypothetical protein CF319_g8020 [Tilletia indica]KAE8232998.1 hypothetical protein CF326_g1964 [Tilletia indica]
MPTSATATVNVFHLAAYLAITGHLIAPDNIAHLEHLRNALLTCFVEKKAAGVTDTGLEPADRSLPNHPSLYMDPRKATGGLDFRMSDVTLTDGGQLHPTLGDSGATTDVQAPVASSAAQDDTNGFGLITSMLVPTPGPANGRTTASSGPYSRPLQLAQWATPRHNHVLQHTDPATMLNNRAVPFPIARTGQDTRTDTSSTINVNPRPLATPSPIQNSIGREEEELLWDIPSVLLPPTTPTHPGREPPPTAMSRPLQLAEWARPHNMPQPESNRTTPELGPVLHPTEQTLHTAHNSLPIEVNEFTAALTAPPTPQTLNFLARQASRTTALLPARQHPHPYRFPSVFRTPSPRSFHPSSVAAMLAQHNHISYPPSLSLWEQALPAPQPPRPFLIRVRTRPLPALTSRAPDAGPGTRIIDWSAAVDLMLQFRDGVPLREFAKMVDAGCKGFKSPRLQRSYGELKENFCDRGRATQMLNAMSVWVCFEICDVWRPGFKSVHTGVRLAYPGTPYHEKAQPELKWNRDILDME